MGAEKKPFHPPLHSEPWQGLMMFGRGGFHVGLNEVPANPYATRGTTLAEKVPIIILCPNQKRQPLYVRMKASTHIGGMDGWMNNRLLLVLGFVLSASD
jgi:hypothetical protein